MTATGTPRLAPIGMPSFGEPTTQPELPPERYPERVEALRGRLRARGSDLAVVWADREHSAGISFLTGFDPRFEEAILVVDAAGRGDPAILVGNECWGMAGAAPLPMRRHLLQDLSLPSQPRDRSRPLAEILADEGAVRGSRVALIGWKTARDRATMEVPSYLVETLRALVGPDGLVENAADLLIDPADGLRVINDADQLALMEWAATRTSGGVRRVLEGIRPGMTEREAVRLLEWDGSPLSCHLMLTAGPRATLGLLSPGDRPIERGDRFTVAFGIWGALNCRAGFAVDDAAELPTGIRDYVDRLVGPYFGAIAEWYGALRCGVTGAVLHEIVARRLGDPFFGIFLNAGHQIHLDEWVNSPVWEGSPVVLRSGMAFQVDVIPATGGPVLHDEHRGRDRPRRRGAPRGAGRPPSGPVDPGPGAPGVHGGPARDRAPRGRPAILEPAGVPAAVRPRARPGDDPPAGMSDPIEVVRLGDDELAVEVLPGIGARLHRIRYRGVDLLRTPDDLRVHLEDGWFWGSFPMAPWCNRLPAGRGRAAGRDLDLPSNFFDGTAIHGQVAEAAWDQVGPGRFSIRSGGDGWPWPYEVHQAIEAGGDRFGLTLAVTNLADSAMPAGVGIHPWFRAPVDVAIRAALVHPSNLDSSPVPEPVAGDLDRRELGPLAEGVDAAWTDLDDPPVVLAWRDERVRATLTASTSAGYIVAARLASSDAIAVEPETHAPAGLRRLERGEPGALELIEPGETLAMSVELRFERVDP